MEHLTNLAGPAVTWAVRAAALLSVALLADVALRRASAAWRHRVLAFGLAGVVVLPLLSLVAPDALAVDAAVLSPVAIEAVPREGVAAPLSDVAAAPVRAASGSIGRGFDVPWLAIALGVWLLGTVSLLVRLARCHRHALRIVAESRPWSCASSPELPVAVGPVDTPMTLGPFRPLIVIPTEARKWSAAQLRLALLHEAAHVRRRDVTWLLVAQVVRAVLFWMPMSWLVVRRMRAHAERAADDAVLEAGARASDYAGLLFAQALRRRAVVPALALAMAARPDVEGRIDRVLDRRRSRRTPTRIGGGLAAAAALSISAAVACVGAEREPAVGRAPVDADVAADSSGGEAGTDPVVQAVADAEAARVAHEVGARVVRIVVVDPRDGRVLALASQGGEGERELVRALPAASTVKPLILGAGLGVGLDIDTVVETGEGEYTMADDRVVQDWRAHGTLTLADAIARSSNIGAVHIVEQVGAERARAFLVGLGLARRPSLRIEGAEAGGVTSDDVSLALGYGVTGTPLGIAAAYGAIANEGVRVEPTFGGDGATERVMSAQTAETLREVLVGAVEDPRATGRNARIDGVTVAGKTGTALLEDATGSRAIFVGMLPVEAPQYVIYVDAEVECQDGSEHSGGSLAAPAFARIGVQLLARR